MLQSMELQRMIDVNLLDNRLIIHESYVVLVKLT